ncbi:MAG: cysteine hydrolase [Ruminococcaceae bacterium]|nr:cysteine hydrolase [Oscillospiraceae bacterium]
MKTLIVVDMQNDFITGALGSKDAEAIVENVVNLVKSFDGRVIFTRDTHLENYLTTQEGRNLPVEHCIKDTHGWQICDELKPYAKEIVDKITFGSIDLPGMIDADTEEVILCGICTDICVISNAMLIKAHYPEMKVSVYASCCAGVTPQSHETALNAMKAVQIKIVE